MKMTVHSQSGRHFGLSQIQSKIRQNQRAFTGFPDPESVKNEVQQAGSILNQTDQKSEVMLTFLCFFLLELDGLKLIFD